MTFPEVQWSGAEAAQAATRRPVASTVAGVWAIVLGVLTILTGLLFLWLALAIGDLLGCDVGCWIDIAPGAWLFWLYVGSYMLVGSVAIVAGVGVLCLRRWAVLVLIWMFGALSALSMSGVAFHLLRPQLPAASGYLLLAFLFGGPALLLFLTNAREDWNRA
jgi:hypothetical protein